MSSISEDKASRLSTLLSNLPGDMADNIVELANEADPEMGRLLNYCRLGPDGLAREVFFSPYEPLIGDRSHLPPSQSLFPLTFIETIWRWLAEDLAPDITDDVTAAVKEFKKELQAKQFDAQRVLASERMVAAISAVDEDPKAIKRLKHRLEIDDFEPVLALAELMSTTPVLRQAIETLPGKIEQISDSFSAEMRDRYEEAANEQTEAGVWVLLMTLPRVEKPWRFLKVFERIAGSDDDFLLSRTDMSRVGDALLDDAEYYLAGFDTAPETALEAERAADQLEQFAQVTVGMTREIGIRKDGAWGQRLFALRSSASEQMEAIHEAARSAFDKALPELNRSRRKRVLPVPGEPEFDAAEAVGSFLFATKDDAARAAVGGAHATLLDELREKAESVANTVLERLRSGQSEAEDADSARLDHVVRLMDVLGDRENGALLLRRAAAAKAA